MKIPETAAYNCIDGSKEKLAKYAIAIVKIIMSGQICECLGIQEFVRT